MSLYLYAWGNNAKRATLKGRKCRVLARGRLDSVLIEFTDGGQREIVSKRALRAVQREPQLSLLTEGAA